MASFVKLYVKNLEPAIDRHLLRKIFSIYGEVMLAKVITDRYGRSRGYGFVSYRQPYQAARAVTEMNGCLLGSRPVFVSLARRNRPMVKDQFPLKVLQIQLKAANRRCPIHSARQDKFVTNLQSIREEQAVESNTKSVEASKTSEASP